MSTNKTSFLRMICYLGLYGIVFGGVLMVSLKYTPDRWITNFQKETNGRQVVYWTDTPVDKKVFVNTRNGGYYMRESGYDARFKPIGPNDLDVPPTMFTMVAEPTCGVDMLFNPLTLQCEFQKPDFDPVNCTREGKMHCVQEGGSLKSVVCKDGMWKTAEVCGPVAQAICMSETGCGHFDSK